MRWKLVVLVSIFTTLIASGCWFVAIFLFFNGPRSIIPLDGKLGPISLPLSLGIPVLLALVSGFFVYRHTSRKRKTQAALTILAILVLTAVVCSTAIFVMRGRKRITPSPLLLVARVQSLSGPASTHRSQTECARRASRPTLRRPDEYHCD
jgi:hypothetical protein